MVLIMKASVSNSKNNISFLKNKSEFKASRLLCARSCCCCCCCCCCCFLGSGPDMGRSPVEWGDFPSVRLSVPPPLGHPARPEAQPARPEAQPARPEAQLARPEA